MSTAAIIDLAHGLELSVVSEGVETARQLSAAAKLGSDRVQGFYLCRTLLIDEFDQRILEPAGRTPVRLPLVEAPALPRQRH